MEVEREEGKLEFHILEVTYFYMCVIFSNYSLLSVTILAAQKITTIPEDEAMVSGVYDHLSPPPTPSSSLTALNTLTRRLSKNKMTLRLLGNMQLEVPKSYDERKHKLNTEIDPFREVL